MHQRYVNDGNDLGHAIGVKCPFGRIVILCGG
jgi:hypothetical protein